MKTSAWGLTTLRLVVGAIFMMHGGQKLFIFGFHNVAGMMSHLGVPLPRFFGVVVTLVEFLGGLGLVVGLLTRWAAFFLAIDMVVAILKVHLPHGFFGPMGYEFPLSLLAASLALMLSGPGAAAIDNVIGHRHG
ncbi:MAG TPA: DoxX family protein [Terriglobia bacterium]|nr:DoxX family protein [Terriglobia bacterium]